MGKLSTSEKAALGVGVGFVAIFLIVFILAFGVAFWGLIAFATCNYLLPLFDISYPLTWTQAFGAGAIVVIVKAIFSSSVTVNK